MFVVVESWAFAEKINSIADSSKCFIVKSSKVSSDYLLSVTKANERSKQFNTHRGISS